MIAGLKPYPAMKDSGVPWLGKVPEHWGVRKLKHLTRFHNGFAFKPSDWTHSGVPIIRIQNLNGSNLFNYTTRSDLPSFLLIRRGDLLFSWSGNRGTSFGPFIWTRDFDGYLNQHIFKLDGYSLDRRYFAHLLQAVTRHIEEQSHGIIGLVHVTKPELGSVLVPVAPPSEQAAVVRFLGHADRRIRRYIRAKQKLIKLLEEQKQAIIHRAVTRGLDPNVRLKPSGVEWLGDVPKHWEVLTLGRALTAIGQGWSPVAAEGQISPNQWAVLTLSSVKRGRFNPGAIKPVSESAKIPSGIETCDGDLLLTRSNTRDLVGDVCIVNGVRPKTVMCDLIYRLTPDVRRFDSTFLMHQLLSRVGRRQIEQDARGSSGTMPKISQRHIRSWRVLSPPLNEQRRISTFIASEFERIDTTIERAQRQIELLREYRTRLIADVVTGKLDVREAATNLPDEEKPELLDGTEVGIDTEEEAPDVVGDEPEEVEA